MSRKTSALVLLLCGAFALAACKKDESATASAAATTTAAATATDAASAAPSGEASAAPEGSGTPAAAAAPAPQRGIEGCCAALAAMATGGRGKRTKNRALRALQICPQLASLVRTGRATRQDALRQVRSGLDGHPPPAACR